MSIHAGLWQRSDQAPVFDVIARKDNDDEQVNDTYINNYFNQTISDFGFCKCAATDVLKTTLFLFNSTHSTSATATEFGTMKRSNSTEGADEVGVNSIIGRVRPAHLYSGRVGASRWDEDTRHALFPPSHSFPSFSISLSLPPAPDSAPASASSTPASQHQAPHRVSRWSLLPCQAQKQNLPAPRPAQSLMIIWQRNYTTHHIDITWAGETDNCQQDSSKLS